MDITPVSFTSIPSRIKAQTLPASNFIVTPLPPAIATASAITDNAIQSNQVSNTTNNDLAMLQDLQNQSNSLLLFSEDMSVSQTPPASPETAATEQNQTTSLQSNPNDLTDANFKRDFLLAQIQRYDQYNQLGGSLMSAGEIFSQFSKLA